MTLPLVIQAASALGEEQKDTQRRFISQALLSMTDPRAATAQEVGKRAFSLWLASLPATQHSSANTRGHLEQFQQRAAEMLATSATAPVMSPHVLALIGGLIAAWLWPRLSRGLS